MKRSIKPNLLKLLTLSAGLLGLVLRLVLYSTGIDHKGLLVSGHWAGIAVSILTGGVILSLIILTRSITGPAQYPSAYPRSVPAGLGCLALALAVLLSCLKDIASPPDSVGTLIRWVLGFLTVVALAVLCICRIAGAKPIFLLHGLVCVYFAVRMVTQYQQWSSDPQIQDYAFYQLALVALMLTAYQHAAFDADMGRHKAVWLMGLAAVYLCLTAVRGTGDTWFLLASALWAFTNLTNLKARPRRQNPQNLQEA